LRIGDICDCFPDSYTVIRVTLETGDGGP